MFVHFMDGRIHGQATCARGLLIPPMPVERPAKTARVVHAAEEIEAFLAVLARRAQIKMPFRSRAERIKGARQQAGGLRATLVTT